MKRANTNFGIPNSPEFVQVSDDGKIGIASAHGLDKVDAEVDVDVDIELNSLELED